MCHCLVSSSLVGVETVQSALGNSGKSSLWVKVKIARLIISWAAYNSQHLRQKQLVIALSVAVHARHETSLSGVRMNPAKHHYTILVLDFVEFLQLGGLTRVGCAMLIGDNHMAQHQRVVTPVHFPAQGAKSLNASVCVVLRQPQEFGDYRSRDLHGFKAVRIALILYSFISFHCLLHAPAKGGWSCSFVASLCVAVCLAEWSRARARNIGASASKFQRPKLNLIPTFIILHVVL